MTGAAAPMAPPPIFVPVVTPTAEELLLLAMVRSLHYGQVAISVRNGVVEYVERRETYTRATIAAAAASDHLRAVAQRG